MYDMGMAKLARVKFVGVDGKEFSVRAIDIKEVEEIPEGSELVLENGKPRKTSSTVTQIDAAIDAFWDAWLLEFPA